MKPLYWLVGVAAGLFLIGGVGTITAFITHAHSARPVFMWIFLAGLVPTMTLLCVFLGIGLYHLYLYRIAKRTPAGWLASEPQDPDGSPPSDY